MTVLARVKSAAATSGIVAILLAGCSKAGQTPALPLGSPASTQPAARYLGFAGLMKVGMSPAKLLALQLERKLPAPVPMKTLRRQLRAMSHARPRLPLRGGAQVVIWASNTNFNYILGQNKRGQRTITAIDGSANGCFSPIGLKVDHAQNLWVGCELRSTSATAGVVQEYDRNGNLKQQYIPACPNPVSECQSFEGYGYDSGLDSNGDVFASLNLYSIETCTPSCVSSLGGGFEWWPAHNPSAPPTLISLGASCAPVCGVGYMDVDGSGNLWFTFSGYDSSSTFGFGLGEVTNPTTNPAFNIVEPIGTYGFFGGVYVTNGGRTLNVIDQSTRTISQYRLPLSPSGTPFNVLGPTPEAVFGVGDPVSGAFNKGETKMAIGDAGGWLDVGNVATNKWSSRSNLNFYSGIDGAAYTPSDK